MRPPGRAFIRNAPRKNDHSCRSLHAGVPLVRSSTADKVPSGVVTDFEREVGRGGFWKSWAIREAGEGVRHS